MPRHPAPLDGYSMFEDEHGQFMWKNCEIPGCPNQVCTWRSERFCYPHSAADLSVDQMINGDWTDIIRKDNEMREKGLKWDSRKGEYVR